MGLDDKKIATELTTIYSSFSPTKLVYAARLVVAYKQYTSEAAACSGSPPSVVNMPGMKSGLMDSLTYDGSYVEIAEIHAGALTTFWTGASFGATGQVLSILGESPLKYGLALLWMLQSLTMTPFPQSAQLHAKLYHAFSKSVLVKDSAIPPPTGCGPSPIN